MILMLLTAAVCGLCMILSLFRPLFLLGALAMLGILTVQAYQAIRASHTDALTGLYNLRHLTATERAYRRCPLIAVWYFDLDHLKLINDTQGHRAGDRLLKDFAHLLRSCSHPGAKAYRIGGDEFLLIVPDPPQGTEPPLHSIQNLPASWGHAIGSGVDLKSLLLYAEQQMYHNRSIR